MRTHAIHHVKKMGLFNGYFMQDKGTHINDIDCGVNSIISKFADDTKLGGKVLSEVERVTVQNDLDKIVSWANKW